jgi:EPS-associated MarR family transcriptional regulator
MIEYRILKELQDNPAHTQRSLADRLDVSLGKINYVLSGLANKGLIKARKLKNKPGQIRWQYILTPQGISEKIRITRSYLRRRVWEFETICRELEVLEKEVGDSPEADEAREAIARVKEKGILDSV